MENSNVKRDQMNFALRKISPLTVKPKPR